MKVENSEVISLAMLLLAFHLNLSFVKIKFLFDIEGSEEDDDPAVLLDIDLDSFNED